MNIINSIGTIIGNGFIAFYFYFQMYFIQMIIFTLLVAAGIIEYSEKQFLVVSDERKVV